MSQQIALFIFIQIALCGAALGGEATDIERCEQNKDTGKGKGTLKKFFYQKIKKECQEFAYGGAGGNENRFDSIKECESACKVVLQDDASKPSICLLPKETGPGKAAFRKFYFDNNERECKQFIYGGLGGNGNRFDTKQECENVCKK
uniref:BPTI/Kunitz inhibitor domain-containing protein n=1 Tax=Globodera pallida TaxID=36090 RepID=A0A183BW84_GLOPA